MTLWAEPPWLQNWDATYPDQSQVLDH